MDTAAAWKQLKEINRSLEHLGALSALAQWDMRTGMPPKAMPDRSEILAFLSAETHKLHTDDRIPELLEAAKASADLTDVERAMIRETEKRYLQAKKVPVDRMAAYTKTLSESEAVWQAARDTNDWNGFQPHLEQVMEFQKEMVDYYGYEEARYDALLDQYEPGATVKQLEVVFSQLRDASVALLDEIRGSGVQIDRSCLSGEFAQQEQKAFAANVLRTMGFDFEAGRLDVSAHPFTTAFCNKDIRITTFYPAGEFAMPLFASIHESGHGIYEQQISDFLKGTGLATGVSMGIHESQSRLFENMLGRSRAFWDHFYPQLQAAMPAFAAVEKEQFYRAINAVEPGAIRIRADELTYNLHIIIRYELEKALLEDALTVAELPDAWNEKYRKYLGVSPASYAEGVMQDIHWASGAVGYFPSYALGNLYSAQFIHRMEQELPDWKQQVAQGQFEGVCSWLGKNIHCHGSVYLPNQLVKKVTGESLQPRYFIQYLQEKFGEIYEL